MDREIAFEMAASSVRFGAGVTREVGMDLVDLGVRRALVVTDANLTRLTPVQTVLNSLDAAGVQAVLYDRVRVEPTDVSFRDAIQFAGRLSIDGIVAVQRIRADERTKHIPTVALTASVMTGDRERVRDHN